MQANDLTMNRGSMQADQLWLVRKEWMGSSAISWTLAPQWKPSM